MAQDQDNAVRRSTVAMDRRAFSRLPTTTEFVIVRTKSGEMTAAKVEDESAGGIGVWLEFRLGIEKLDTMHVIYTKAVVPAIVRRIEVIESPTGETIFAGLEWTTPMPQ
jgi:hypothetical protein